MSHPSGKTRSSTRAQPVADRAQADDYLKAFLALFPPRVVQRIARESGFVRRHRKLDPVAFLYTLAFETGPQLQRTLDGLRDAYNKRTPDPILSTGGSYERFTPELVEFLRRCVAYGLAQLQVAPGNRLTPKLARFTDLLIQDSTVIRLFAALAKVYPPTRLAKNTRSKRTAGVKVATLFSARANGPARLELFPETTSEIDTLKVGTWVKGSSFSPTSASTSTRGSLASRRMGGSTSPVSRPTPTRCSSARTSCIGARRSNWRGSGGRRSVLASTAKCSMPRWSCRSSVGRIGVGTAAIRSGLVWWPSGTRFTESTPPM